VLLSKHRLADRWTRRTYTIRPGSLSATCAGSGGTCRVKGIVSWKLENPEAKSSSRGVASFEYGVVDDGEGFQVTAETTTDDKQSATSSPLKQAGRKLQQLLGRLSKLGSVNTSGQTAVKPKAPTAR